MSHGNQYASRYGDLMEMLQLARMYLAAGFVSEARFYLRQWREEHAQAPASTRRRWRCGK
jgi:hypothetical protein